MSQFIIEDFYQKYYKDVFRGGSRTAATSKIEYFVIIVNGLKPLTIITKCSILGVAAVLDPPMVFYSCFLRSPESTRVYAEAVVRRTSVKIHLAIPQRIEISMSQKILTSQRHISLFRDGDPYHIETSPVICFANQ